MRRLAGASLVFLLVAACGGGDPGITTTVASVSTVPASASSTSPQTSTTTAGQTTATAGSTATTGPEIEIYFEEGDQVVGPDRFSFGVGDQVSIWLLSDSDEEIHVHGYDVTFYAKAGIPLEIALAADVPGIFEVELEETSTLLFELVVSP